jgi:hypothetical protein
MHAIMCQLNMVTRILEYIDYYNYFFIANIDFLGGWLSRKLELIWRLKSSQGNNNYLGGCQPSRKLFFLAAINPQANYFPWRSYYFLGTLAS